MNFGDVGTICLNREMRQECQDCLWWEWDSQKKLCSNCQSPICALYRKELFFSWIPAQVRQFP